MSHSYSLLYVDDDPMAITHMRSLLQPFLDLVTPEFTGSPTQALEAHRERKYDIVISDLRLGTTTGLNLIGKMKEKMPESAYLLVSGDADLSAALAAVNEAKVIRFLVKPCQQADLKTGLMEAAGFLKATRKLEEVAIATTALGRTNIAVASFDMAFRLVYANDIARKLLEEKTVIGLCASGHLISKGTLTTAELHYSLKESLFDKARPGMPVACPSGDASRQLLLYPSLSSPGDGRPEHADLLILDPSTPKQIAPAMLANALKLSIGEANVVSNLAAGLTIEEIGEACNLSVSTVRTYLKNAFAKTGASRQAEIVSLALRTSL